MAHQHVHLDRDITRLKPANKTLGMALMVIGLIAVVVAFFAAGGNHTRFWFAYLFGLSGVTAVAGCSLIFVLIHHLVRAGWITNIRRINETIAVQLPLIGLLFIPIILVVVSRTGTLYSWSQPVGTAIVEEHAAPAEPGQVTEQDRNAQVMPGVLRPFDEGVAHKTHSWLYPPFWALRIFFYFTVMGGIAWYYWSQSVKQDATGDIDINSSLSASAGPLLAVTGALFMMVAWDVYMTLDPKWFSTMYGVYYFASGTQAMWAVLALSVLILQSRGYLRESITLDQRHDLGKFMWAFIVFFAYIAFDQYMLQWYANLPEETFFYDKRGYSTSNPNGYTILVQVLLWGRFVIPFLGLVSRHVKRSRFGLGFWSIWLLAAFVVDLYLIVIPDESSKPLFGLTEILGFAGITVLVGGNALRTLASHELRPISDPRIHEAVAVQNI